MRLSEVATITYGRFFTPTPTPAVLNRDVKNCGSADLMSDVLCYNISQGLLITGLINPQTVRTAEMVDVTAILIVRGKTPPPETINIAAEIGIPILGTDLTMFEACGRLFAAGLPAAGRAAGSPPPDCTAR
jgi:hypothetical protein